MTRTEPKYEEETPSCFGCIMGLVSVLAMGLAVYLTMAWASWTTDRITRLEEGNPPSDFWEYVWEKHGWAK